MIQLFYETVISPIVMHFFNTQRKKIKQNRKKGAALFIIVFFFMFSSSAVVFGSIGSIVRDFKSANALTDSKTAYFLAEAGVEDVLYRIKNNLQVSDTEEIALNGATTTVTVSNSGTNEKSITSRSSVSGGIRTIEADVTTGQGIAFSYGLQVGAGGVEVGKGSTITGNVYSNGVIKGDDKGLGVTITGDATAAMMIEEDSVEQSIVCNTDNIVGKTNSQEDWAQSFQVSTTTPLAKISLYIKKVGDADSGKIRIVKDKNGSPDDDDIEDEDLNKNLVTTSYGWVDIVFENEDNKLSLTPGQTYWIVFDAKKNNSKYWVWCSDSNAGYANGDAKYSEDWDSDPWTSTPGDLAFKVSYGTGESKIEELTINGTARAGSIDDTTILGDAYYQTIKDSTVGGTSYPGSAIPSPINPPVSQGNIDQWKADAVAGTTYNGDCGDSGVAGCTSSSALSLGPAKITGDLNLKNNQTLIVTGSLHVQGNLDIDGNSTIQCDLSYGSKSCVIVVDGWMHFKNNITFSGSGDPDSYIMLLTTIVGCLDDISSSHCTSHEAGVDIHENIDASGSIIYSTDSAINTHNNVNIGILVAYELEVGNNATITYESGVANTDFSSDPDGGWNIKEWKEAE